MDYGSIHLTTLNDSPLDMGVLAGSTATFLTSDLTANATRPWRFVLHHKPIYSSSLGHGSDLALRALWQPIYDAQRPDLVLNGHDHTYERTKPLRNGAEQATAADGRSTWSPAARARRSTTRAATSLPRSPRARTASC